MIDKMVNCTAAQGHGFDGCSLWGLYGWPRVNSFRRGRRFERYAFNKMNGLDGIGATFVV